jgi:hypothetical protein
VNLFDCRLYYFAVPSDIVTIQKPTQLFRDFLGYKSYWYESSAKRLKQLNKVLKFRKISELRGNYCDGNLEDMYMLEGRLRVELPMTIHCGYEHLSNAELKTYISCYHLDHRNRKSRERQAGRKKRGFTFIATHETLAEAANLSVRSVQDALKSIEARKLIATEVVKNDAGMRLGTQITMLAPDGNAVPLYEFGRYHHQGMRILPIADRYNLHIRFNGKGRPFQFTAGQEYDNLPVTCPLQMKDKDELGFTRSTGPCRGEMRITIPNDLELPGVPRMHKRGKDKEDIRTGNDFIKKVLAASEGDRFQCAKCKRTGDSMRLLALMSYQDIDFRQQVRDIESKQLLPDVIHPTTSESTTSAA